LIVVPVANSGEQPARKRIQIFQMQQRKKKLRPALWLWVQHPSIQLQPTLNPYLCLLTAGQGTFFGREGWA